MEISFTHNATRLHGSVTTNEKNNEFFYTLILNGISPFTIHLSDEGHWQSDDITIDPMLVMLAGDAIENMEDLSDVLFELDTLRN